MSTSSPHSLPPSKVPGTSSGSGQYIALAVVLILVMGGLVYWKTRSNEASSAPPVPSAPAPTASAPVRAPMIDAPPPPPEEDAGAPAPSSTVAKGVKGAGGGFGCSASSCSGTPAGGMRGELAARAGNARGCYERALRVNPNLQGKLTVSLRVDPNGVICQANIGNDSVGSGEVSSCVLSMFRGQKVSAPSGGCVDVAVPLNFQPKNK
jgi:hypothetical protein